MEIKIPPPIIETEVPPPPIISPSISGKRPPSMARRKWRKIYPYIIAPIGFVVFFIGFIIYILPVIASMAGITRPNAELPPPPPIEEEAPLPVPYSAFGRLVAITGDTLVLEVEGGDGLRSFTLTISATTEMEELTFANADDLVGTYRKISSAELKNGDLVAVYGSEVIGQTEGQLLTKVIKTQ